MLKRPVYHWSHEMCIRDRDDVCRWNVGEIVYNRERRGAKMDPALYTKDEIQLIEDEVGFDKMCIRDRNYDCRALLYWNCCRFLSALPE